DDPSHLPMASTFLSAPSRWSSPLHLQAKGEMWLKKRCFVSLPAPGTPAGSTQEHLLQRSPDVCEKVRLILTSALPRGDARPHGVFAKLI
ncbi:hypothetical protein ATANTOWER_003423, partial [Ataeniobius toweri]|nr:hypothetical protein [Ataeniobius toweri]